MACWKLAQLWGFKHEEQKFYTTKLKFKNETIKNLGINDHVFLLSTIKNPDFTIKMFDFTHHQTFGISAPGGYHGYHYLSSWKQKRCA
jgi:hypothetical protein